MAAAQPFDPAELALLANEVDSAQLLFRMMQARFVERMHQQIAQLDTDMQQQPNPAAAADTLAVRRALVSHPQRAELERELHKDLFSKLKSNYLEQDAKERFLRRVLETPPLYVSDQTVRDLMDANAVLKDTLKAHKANVDQLRNDVLENASHICSTYAKVEQQKNHMKQLEIQITTLTTESEKMREKAETVMTTSTTRREAMDTQASRTRDQAKQIAELRQAIVEKKTMIDVAKTRHGDCVGELERLRVRHDEAEAHAREAARIAESKDPHIEELGRWYKTAIEILYKCNGVKSVKAVSELNMEIVYDMDAGDVTSVAAVKTEDGVMSTVSVPTTMPSTYTVNVRLALDADSEGKRHIVEAQVVDGHTVDLTDILDNATQFPKLDHALSYTVRAIYTRLRHLHQRHVELDALCAATHDNVMYDRQSGEVLVHVERTGRAFVFLLDVSYPTSMWQGIRVVGVEPVVVDHETDVWMDRIRQLKPATLTALVPYLE